MRGGASTAAGLGRRRRMALDDLPVVLRARDARAQDDWPASIAQAASMAVRIGARTVGAGFVVARGGAGTCRSSGLTEPKPLRKMTKADNAAAIA